GLVHGDTGADRDEAAHLRFAVPESCGSRATTSSPETGFERCARVGSVSALVRPIQKLGRVRYRYIPPSVYSVRTAILSARSRSAASSASVAPAAGISAGVSPSQVRASVAVSLPISTC